jgi:SAM-dependent methyltransferase
MDGPGPDLERQRRFWTHWNETSRDPASQERATFVLSAVERHIGRDARIVELGCGTGWLSDQLAGLVASVTAVDFADEVVGRAQRRYPRVHFLAGDVMTQPTDAGYDAVVSVQTLAHVADQAAFIDRMADLLKPEGLLILETQNSTTYSRARWVRPPEGQIRKWVTRRQFRKLAECRFRVMELRTILPGGDKGLLRLLNGRKFSQVWGSIIGHARWRALREAAGLGMIMALVARKADPPSVED